MSTETSEEALCLSVLQDETAQHAHPRTGFHDRLDEQDSPATCPIARYIATVASLSEPDSATPCPIESAIGQGKRKRCLYCNVHYKQCLRFRMLLLMPRRQRLLLTRRQRRLRATHSMARRSLSSVRTGSRQHTFLVRL